MKLAIAYQDGQVADASGCTEYLIITAQGGEPSGKELMAAPGAGSTAMLTFLGMVQADVFICGALGVAMRNALEMLGIVLVPGVTGRRKKLRPNSLSAKSRAIPASSRLAARMTRTIRWPACTIARSARAAARCACRKRRSKTCLR